MKQDIYNYEETSKLYFADDKYFGDVRSDLHREETSLKDISDTLIHAVIATEDQYFNQHKGVVPKAIVRAVLQEALNADVKTGGSTLTQQLIKNQILTNEVSFERKAKEILLALRLERFFDKGEILEAYLNIIPYGRDAAGRNIAGVQTAAKGIFNVDAKDVNLPQAAYLAGLPQSPSYYTPYVNSGGLKDEDELQPGINRMKSVLSRMYDAEYITEKEYKKALNYDIAADFKKKTKSPIEQYPYLTYEIEDRAKEKILEYLVKEDGKKLKDVEKNEKLYEEYEIRADRDLRMKGYEIHSTIDKKVYDAFQKVTKKYEYYGNDRTITVTDEETGETTTEVEPVQTGSMLIENSSGRIISFVGGREFNHEKAQWNYATKAKRPNGSTMKPLLDYGPAMEKGVVQPGTPIADISASFQYAGMPKPWSPGNYAGGYHGIVSARQALANSYNVPAAKTYMKIINDDPSPAKEFLDKMGITTLTKGDYGYPSLSLGQPTNGITIEENINAFSTFGNNGKFNDAYMIDKITTNDGEVIYEHKSEPKEVFSPQTNYLTVDLMRDVIKYGTAAYVNSQLKYGGVDWAGKTGTSQFWEDAWFVGVNPNVTLGTWIGYDTPHSLQDTSYPLSYSQRNEKLWAELINKATEIRPDLMAPTERFKRPDGIVERSYCAISGMLPSDLCEKAGLIKSDLFNAKYVPTKVDDSLTTGNFVIVNGKAVMAGPNTPSEFTDGDGLTFNPEFLKRKGYDKLGDISVLFPRTERDKWEKIGIPTAKVGSALKDDGKAPGAPASLKKSGNKLTWGKSGSNDVVGYRVYRADKPGGNYSLVDSTTSTSYSVGNDTAVYVVKSVDYFGLESGKSNEVSVGEQVKEDKEEVKKDDKNKDEAVNKEQDKDEDKDEGKKDDKKDEGPKDNGSEEDESSADS